MTATTFDSVQKSNTNLSGGNLVATSTNTGGVRSTRPITSILTYGEATITTLTGVPAIGFATRTWTNTFDLGSQNNTVGYHSNGQVKCNNAVLSTIATFAAGNRIGWAHDILNRLVWFRVNGGLWNNSGTADPATGVGGIDYSASLTAPDTMYAAVSASLTGNVWTANFSAPVDTAPAGFALLDVAGYTAANSTEAGADVPPVASLPSYGVRGSPLPEEQTTHGKHFNGTTVTNVSGITKEGGVAVAGKRVEVYDRISGDLLGTTVSDGSGLWQIPCLGRPSVRVVGSDPTTFNSVVFDNVVPV